MPRSDLKFDELQRAATLLGHRHCPDDSAGPGVKRCGFWSSSCCLVAGGLELGPASAQSLGLTIYKMTEQFSHASPWRHICRRRTSPWL